MVPPLTPSMNVSEYQGLQGVRSMQRGKSLSRSPGESTESIRVASCRAIRRGHCRVRNRSPCPWLLPRLCRRVPSQLWVNRPFRPPPIRLRQRWRQTFTVAARTQGLDLRAPTERRAMAMPQQTGYQSTSYGLDQSRTVQAAANPNIIAPPVQPSTEKPFSGYQTPSGISPYMNIYRSGTNNGTIDNYTTLVKPQLDQRYLNQQYGRDIRGLQGDSRTQGQSLQQQSRQLQGVSTPQFYMNYGNYYSFPGGGQGP